MTRRTLRWLWSLAILAGLLLALKSLVCGVYRVDTPSMEPAILGSSPGGERVLVFYGGGPPARFDPVVVLRKGEDVPLVKRVCGLPDERVQIVGGDLLVGGKRLGPEVARPRAIPVFDERWQAPEEAFPIPAAAQPFWKRASGEWLLAARKGTGPECTSRLEYHGDVKDSFFDAQHVLVRGEIPVNDLVLELELWQEEPGTSALLTLSEAGDVFELALALGEDGALDAKLSRLAEDPEQPPEVLASRTLARGAPGWHALRFSNIDNALCLERDGQRVLQVEYDENRFSHEDPLHIGHNRLPRASFGGAGGEMRFRGLRLSRDLYYTERGDYATHKALDLGPGGYFLLGDNSAQSRDGRDWGETHAEELIGKPWRVIWPLSHARALEGAVPPPPLLR